MRPQDVLEFLERKFQQHSLYARDQHTTAKERQILKLFEGKVMRTFRKILAHLWQTTIHLLKQTFVCDFLG